MWWSYFNVLGQE